MVVALGEIVSDPLGSVLEVQGAEQEVAPEVHARVELPPAGMIAGFAVRLTVESSTQVPPIPVQSASDIFGTASPLKVQVPSTEVAFVIVMLTVAVLGVEDESVIIREVSPNAMPETTKFVLPTRAVAMFSSGAIEIV